MAARWARALPFWMLLPISWPQSAWQFFWSVVALNVLQLGWKVENLWSGRWQRPQPVEQMVYRAFGFIPLLFLLNARDHVLVLLKHPALDSARYGAALGSINYWVNRAFLIIAVITALQLVWDLGRMSLDAYRKREAAMQ